MPDGALKVPDRSNPTEDPKSSYSKAKSAALRLLSYRSRSENEVQRRLRARFTQDAIDRVVSDLRDEGLLDDSSFAKEWREQRERFKPRGSAAIRQELQRLGVVREVVRETLSDFDESSNAYKAGYKYAVKLSLDNRSVFKRKLGGFLQRRGFRRDVLAQTVERIWRELFNPLNGCIDGNGQHDQPEEFYAP